VTNPERDPQEVVCAAGPGTRTGPVGQVVEVIAHREVPLGGLRAMTVRRTLPSKQRSLVGAWCFADHYGPDLVSDTGGMSVAPHPHTGLQTVSWLFTGEIEHRDSGGHHAMVRPGELNLMTAGRGISHSEVSTAATTELHGVQLWVALPDGARHGDPAFAHYAPPAVTGDGWEARVFLGSLLGSASPVATASPLLGAEILLTPGAALSIDVDATYEHGVLVDRGSVAIAGEEVGWAALGYAAPGRASLDLVAGPDGARLVLLGGPPFGEQIVMWWNFVGRTHEEVVAFRQEWQDQLVRDGALVRDSQEVAAGRFGVVVGDHLPPIPAPEMPQGVRLRSRG
jgi:redox-sensitive bicupin YhaK (pirin superfamily)